MSRPLSPSLLTGAVLILVVAAVLVMAQVIDDSGGKVDGAATPRGALARQLALIRAGDVETLRTTFTERLRDQITEDAVRAAAETLGATEPDELVGSEEEVGVDPQRVKLYTPGDRRTLATFVRVGDRWLADTIWFR